MSNTRAIWPLDKSSFFIIIRHETRAGNHKSTLYGSWLSEQVIHIGCLAFVSYSQGPLHYQSKGEQVKIILRNSKRQVVARKTKQELEINLGLHIRPDGGFCENKYWLKGTHETYGNYIECGRCGQVKWLAKWAWHYAKTIMAVFATFAAIK